jgi:hypothetical protein
LLHNGLPDVAMSAGWLLLGVIVQPDVAMSAGLLLLGV